jgi:hypothetical protein
MYNFNNVKFKYYLKVRPLGQYTFFTHLKPIVNNIINA